MRVGGTLILGNISGPQYHSNLLALSLQEYWQVQSFDSFPYHSNQRGYGYAHLRTEPIISLGMHVCFSGKLKSTVGLDFSYLPTLSIIDY